MATHTQGILEKIESLYSERGDGAPFRRALSALLKGELVQTQAQVRAGLEAFSVNGIQAAAALSASNDRVLSALFEFAWERLFHSIGRGSSERLSVIAVGGYGRGELAPFSDLDLLFLRPAKPSPEMESATEFVLYTLWDMGMKVGHATRTQKEALRFARDDHTGLTQLLEARCVCGDEALWLEIRSQLTRQVIKGQSAAFLDAKLSERSERLKRQASASRYEVEPNIKLGRGGLRDLHVLTWIAEHLRRDPQANEADPFTADERRVFEEAREFFWRVRMTLHWLAGGANERLTFDVQPEIAARLQFRDADGTPDVEGFMRWYFGHVRAVGGLTRILCAMLEARHGKSAPSGFARLLSPLRRRRTREVPGFILDHGRLDFEKPEVVRDDPALMVRLFQAADTLDVDIHPRAMALAARHADRIGDGVRSDARAAASFLNFLETGQTRGRVLRLMTECGVLGAFLPEFGQIVGRTQFSLYHRYTVDEHTLQLVDTLDGLFSGSLSESHGPEVQVAGRQKDISVLYLAALLHDVGKGAGDQCVEGEKLALAACTRMGLSEGTAHEVAWLVRHHLDFSDTAQKRDLEDAETVLDFVRHVGSPTRLDHLYLLTVADICAVGPGVWTEWKATLLRRLYTLSRRAMETRQDPVAPAVGETQARFLRSKIAKAFPVLAQHFTQTLPPEYWSGQPVSAIREQFALYRDVQDCPDDQTPRARVLITARGGAQLLVVAKDRVGLFADVTTGIAALGVDVRKARIYSSNDGWAIEVFQVDPAPFSGRADAAFANRFSALVAAAAGGRLPKQRPEPEALTRRERVFKVAPRVEIHSDLARTSTIIEVTGRDRAGLLRDLVRVLTDHGLNIDSSHIQSVGERAVDVFYVTARDGQKLKGAEAMQALTQALIDVLGTGTPVPPEMRNQPLAQARSSDQI